MIQFPSNESTIDTVEFQAERPVHASDQFHSILRRLPWPSTRSEPAMKAIGFTSCLGKEGVSSIALQTAYAATSLTDKRILIVDGHVANPAFQDVFQIRGTNGFCEFLRGESDLSEVLQKTEARNLWVLGTGNSDHNPSGIFGVTDRLHELIKQVRLDFDLTIFDLPPVGYSDAALSLIRLLDGVVLVVEAERVREDFAQRVVQRLCHENVKLIGAVMNAAFP